MGNCSACLQCRFALNVDPLDRSHSEKQVLNQERLLDIYRELAKILLVLRTIGFSSARRWRVFYKSRILRRDVIVIQMRPFEQPVGQVRNSSFHHFEHAGGRDFGSICRNEVILLPLHLKIVTEGTLEADVIEGGHFVTIGHFARIQNCPFGQLGNAIAALFILLVLFDSHLTVALEGEEVTFGRLEANRGAESNWLLAVSILEIQQGQLLALAHLQVRHLY